MFMWIWIFLLLAVVIFQLVVSIKFPLHISFFSLFCYFGFWFLWKLYRIYDVGSSSYYLFSIVHLVTAVFVVFSLAEYLIHCLHLLSSVFSVYIYIYVRFLCNVFDLFAYLFCSSQLSSMSSYGYNRLLLCWLIGCFTDIELVKPVLFEFLMIIITLVLVALKLH